MALLHTVTHRVWIMGSRASQNQVFVLTSLRLKARESIDIIKSHHAFLIVLLACPVDIDRLDIVNSFA